MITAGMDVGSRTIKMVLFEKGRIIFSRTRENSFNPSAVCDEMLREVSYDKIIATGYGRHLVKERLGCEVISEIKAFAIGGRALFKTCRTVLDIGGQDTKAISLDESGRLSRFEMNDRCAAGTGRFLEMSAMALGLSLEDFALAGNRARRAEKINSMCAVFAESEIVSLIARGACRDNIALGIHQSIAERCLSMLNRVGINEEVVFGGGVALNPCMKKLLEAGLGISITVPDDPQIIGALGCAIKPVM